MKNEEPPEITYIELNGEWVDVRDVPDYFTKTVNDASAAMEDFIMSLTNILTKGTTNGD